MNPKAKKPWLNGDVWVISLSACFADLGYQAVLAGFPLFLVLYLHRPIWEFGLASSLSYGGGAIFSWLGGRLGDSVGHKKVAVFGNCLIPLLALSGLVASPVWAIGFLCGGWWFRNLRSPSRRVMLAQAVPEERYRASAFGFLHALDVGGGALAGIWVLVCVVIHEPWKWIFLLAAVPLVASTIFLIQATTGESTQADKKSEGGIQKDAGSSGGPSGDSEVSRNKGVKRLLLSAGLYGFTAYSVGFPVLTVAKGSHKLVYGIGAFLVLQVVSSATGYIVGPRVGGDIGTQFRWLGLLGYIMAGFGASILAFSQVLTNTGVLIVGVAIIGFGLGVIETFEPSAMSILKTGSHAGRGFAGLSAARSIGTFVGNLAMGLLYSLGAGAAYGYAGIVALIAGALVISAISPIRSWQDMNNRQSPN